MPENVIKLREWALVEVPTKFNPYEAPENRTRAALHGQREDKRWATTSTPVSIEGDVVTTASGSKYRLLNPDPDYAKQFPKPLKRLQKSLGAQV